jgi:hypothetical protein
MASGQLARGAKLGNPQIANARRRAVEAVKAEADHPARKILPLIEKSAGQARRHFEKLSMRSTRLAMQLRPKYACGSPHPFHLIPLP